MAEIDKAGADKAPVIKEKGTNTPTAKAKGVSKAPVAPKKPTAPVVSEDTTDKAPKELIEKADNYFKENPKVKEVYISADGFLFTNRNFACNHAATLENKEPLHFKNPATFEVVE